MPKVIAFVLLAGVVIYGLVWLSMRLRAGQAKPAPLAPDDDPAFLAQLDRRLAEERRQKAVKEAREAQARAKQAENDGPAGEQPKE